MTVRAKKLSFNDESSRLLEDLEDTLLGRRVRNTGQGILQAMLSVLGSVAQIARTFNQQPTADFSENLLQVLEMMKSGEIEVSGNAISLIFDCSNHMKSLLRRAAEGGNPDSELLDEGEFLIAQFLGLKNQIH